MTRERTTPRPDAAALPRLLRLLPFLSWPRPDRSTLAKDAVAGLTVGLLLVPQGLAYAQLAGVPAQLGLYAAFLPTIVGALFGSSALLATGPVALTSLLAASSVAATTAAPGSTDFVAQVVLLALLSGLIQIALGLARAGALVSLLSHPVVVGFINAAAIVIGISQLPALLGIAVPPGLNTVVGLGALLSAIGSVHGPSLAFGLATIGLLVAFRRLSPRLPGVLLTVAVMTLASAAVGFEARGGQVVGTIPGGLPTLALPRFDWQTAMALVPAAFVIALLSFIEAMSSCKSIAIKTRTRWDVNQELIGQGLAKLASAACQSIPVSGSFSRSAMNLVAGGRTGWCSVFAGGFVLVTLLMLTPLLHDLPKPVLSAVIIVAVANLVDVAAMRSAWLANPDDGLAAGLTFAAAIAFAPNVQNGMLAGMLFALGAFIYRRMVPRYALVDVTDDGRQHDRAAPPAAAPPPGALAGVAAFRFEAALFFANVSQFEDIVLGLQRRQPRAEAIVVFAGSINLVDASAIEMLRSLVRDLRAHRVDLVFAGAKPQIVAVFERTGLLAEIGADHFIGSDPAALRAWAARRGIAAAPMAIDDRGAGI